MQVSSISRQSDAAMASFSQGRAITEFDDQPANPLATSSNPLPCVLPGAELIEVADDQIRSVQGYFDQRAIVEQLGLQVIDPGYSLGIHVNVGCGHHGRHGRPPYPSV
jgi:hypothetical protein